MADQRPIPNPDDEQLHLLTQLRLRGTARTMAVPLALREATWTMAQLDAFLLTTDSRHETNSGVIVIRQLEHIMARLMRRLIEIRREQDQDQAIERDLWRNVTGYSWMTSDVWIRQAYSLSLMRILLSPDVHGGFLFDSLLGEQLNTFWLILDLTFHTKANDVVRRSAMAYSTLTIHRSDSRCSTGPPWDYRTAWCIARYNRLPLRAKSRYTRHRAAEWYTSKSLTTTHFDTGRRRTGLADWTRPMARYSSARWPLLSTYIHLYASSSFISLFGVNPRFGFLFTFPSLQILMIWQVCEIISH